MYFRNDSYDSQSGLEEPRGTRTVRNEQGVREITTCSVLLDTDLMVSSSKEVWSNISVFFRSGLL